MHIEEALEREFEDTEVWDSRCYTFSPCLLIVLKKNNVILLKLFTTLVKDSKVIYSGGLLG